MVWLIVNAVRYVVNKIRGKDEDGKKEDGGIQNQKCMLAGSKNDTPKEALIENNGAQLSTDSSVTKRPCASSGGWG